MRAFLVPALAGVLGVCVAGFGQTARHTQTDTAVAAGDDGDFAGEIECLHEGISFGLVFYGISLQQPAYPVV